MPNYAYLVPPLPPANDCASLPSHMYKKQTTSPTPPSTAPWLENLSRNLSRDRSLRSGNKVLRHARAARQVANQNAILTTSLCPSIFDDDRAQQQESSDMGQLAPPGPHACPAHKPIDKMCNISSRTNTHNKRTAKTLEMVPDTACLWRRCYVVT